MKHRRLLTAGFAAAAVVGFASPALASPVNSDRVSCSVGKAKPAITAWFTIGSHGKYGTLKEANANGREGGGDWWWTDDPSITFTIRDGYGNIVARRTSDDGSMVEWFNLPIGGRKWSAQATANNTSEGTCTTPPVKIAYQAVTGG